MSKIIPFVTNIIKSKAAPDDITIYSHTNIKHFLTELFKMNSIDKIGENDYQKKSDYERSISLIVNIYMSDLCCVLDENNKIKKIKKMIDDIPCINIMNYSQFLKSKISQNYSRIETKRKSIIIILQRILNIKSCDMFNYINVSDRNSFFNEEKFFRLIEKGSFFMKEFIEKYRITKILCYKKNVFDKIIKDYQSFNYYDLSDVYQNIFTFEKFYKFYKYFEPILAQVNNIYNKVKSEPMINKNYYEKNYDTIFSAIEHSVKSFCDIFEDTIEEKLTKIKNENNEKLKKLENEMKDKINKLEKENIRLKNDINNLKNRVIVLEKENITLKNENNNLKNRLTKLEGTFKNIKKDLVCPITKKIFKNPVIICSGVTYEKSSLNDNITDSKCYPNNVVKNIILKCNDIL